MIAIYDCILNSSGRIKSRKIERIGSAVSLLVDLSVLLLDTDVVKG